MSDGCVLWNPEVCVTCREKLEVIENPDAPKEVKSACRVALKAWARGFSKNRPGEPFLTSEKFRGMFFPKTEARFVWGTAPARPAPAPSTSAPLPTTMPEQVTISLSHVDLSNEEMVDLMTEEELLREPSNPSTFRGFDDKKQHQDDTASVISSIMSEAPTAYPDDTAATESEASVEQSGDPSSTGAIPKVNPPPGFPAVPPAAKYIGTNRITTEIKLHSVSRVSASVLTTEGFSAARVKAMLSLAKR